MARASSRKLSLSACLTTVTTSALLRAAAMPRCTYFLMRMTSFPAGSFSMCAFRSGKSLSA